MKKSVLKEYFLLTPDVKLTEKVFLTRMILSITSIVICLVSMTYCAVAYFGHDNIAVTADIERFNADITPSQSAKKLSNNTFLLQNQTDGASTYEFLISQKSKNDCCGYCRISVADNDGNIYNYYTQPIGRFLKDGQTVYQNSYTVFVTVKPQTSVTINFTLQSGSCALPTITNGKIELK